MEKARKSRGQQEPLLDVQVFSDNDRRNPQRRYAPPKCNEVAASSVGNDSVGFPEHVLAVRSRSSGLQIIDFDPMWYPLFSPSGTTGFHPSMKKARGGNVSVLEVSSSK